MSQLKEKRAESIFEDYKPAYNPTQAAAEANRCLYCYDAPCITACPTSINIPQFIRRIANDNTKGAAKSIFDANILGMSCARVCPVEVLCVGDCVYNEMGVPPIQIGKLQRFATDEAYEKGWSFHEAGADTGKSVALIGGGPASLAAAHRLRRFGHRVTIFEKGDILGGLNTFGVAPYKMRADAAVAEVSWILDIGGIDIQSNTAIPQDKSWADLESEFDAIFIGFGLGPDRLMDIPGANAEGVVGAVEFIEKFKLHDVDLSAVKRAAVVGGGNTAIDAVRELIGLGISDVVMIYRGDEDRMSGYHHEWLAAKKEGATASWRSQPTAFITEEERVVGVYCDRLDENKRPIQGDTLTVDADLVLMAIGQGKLGALVADLDGVEVSGGKIVCDAGGATGRAGIYAGGDCANGGKEVVNAAAEGKAAAESIHSFLMGGQNG